MSDSNSETIDSTLAGTAGSECACGEAGTTVANLAKAVPHPYADAGAQIWATSAIQDAAVFSGLWGFTTVLLSIWLLYQLRVPAIQPSKLLTGTLAVMTVFWAVLPPIWFWYEYWYIYVPHGDGAPDAFAQFRHNQQLSAAIWAGILAASATILSRAYGRKLELPKTDEGQTHPYAIYGSASASVMSNDGSHVLLWSGPDKYSAGVQFDLLWQNTPFNVMHLVECSGDVTTIKTETRFKT